MTYMPVYDTSTGEIIEWTDQSGARYPTNPEHDAAEIKEHEDYMDPDVPYQKSYD